MSGGWQSSDRRSRLPKNWPQLVAATKARAAGRCEGISLDGEPRWHDDDCGGIGHQCDHDKAGDDHRPSNLRWLSEPCHLRKTQHEATLALRAQAAKAKYPREQHPGIRST